METGIVSNIQKYSLQDGPGIRTTVFLKGCPLDCWWCHNPEGRSPRPEVVVTETRCLRCGECVKRCPESDEDWLAETQLLPPNQCRLCGACLDACSTGARQIIGRRMSVAEIMAAILQDRLFYEESGGGATFSGGEPLMQAALVERLLAACRQAGVSAALDTCGFAPAETVLRVASQADLILYDLKLMDEARHLKYTGVSNVLILANLRALARQHPRVWVRIPVIPGINDRPGDLNSLAKFVAALGRIEQVNLLPYHQTGMAKFARLGEEYRLPEVKPPSHDQMAAAAAIFTAHGLRARIGG